MKSPRHEPQADNPGERQTLELLAQAERSRKLPLDYSRVKNYPSPEERRAWAERVAPLARKAFWEQYEQDRRDGLLAGLPPLPAGFDPVAGQATGDEGCTLDLRPRKPRKP